METPLKVGQALSSDPHGVQLIDTHVANEHLSSSVRRILIVGAGGFGRETLHWARDAWPDHSHLLVGFISADAGMLADHDCPLPIVSDPSTFKPQRGDALLLGIGIPRVRRRVAEDLLARGAEFLTLIHPRAVVAGTASIGCGSIVCPGAIVSDAARVGRFGLVNYHASLAHDAGAGDFAVFSPGAAVAGHSCLGDDVFLGMNASVGPGVNIGARSKVAANSCALTHVPADSLVHGVPGRVSPLLG